MYVHYTSLWNWYMKKTKEKWVREKRRRKGLTCRQEEWWKYDRERAKWRLLFWCSLSLRHNLPLFHFSVPSLLSVIAMSHFFLTSSFEIVRLMYVDDTLCHVTSAQYMHGLALGLISIRIIGDSLLCSDTWFDRLSLVKWWQSLLSPPIC